MSESWSKCDAQSNLNTHRSQVVLAVPIGSYWKWLLLLCRTLFDQPAPLIIYLVTHNSMWFLQSVPARCAVHLCWNRNSNLKTQLSFHPAAAAKFRRDSLFCPDELDSLFSYFDTGSGPRSKSPHSVHIQARCIFRICLKEPMNLSSWSIFQGCHLINGDQWQWSLCVVWMLCND